MSVYSSTDVYPPFFDEDGYCENCGFCKINDYCPHMVGDDV